MPCTQCNRPGQSAFSLYDTSHLHGLLRGFFHYLQAARNDLWLQPPTTEDGPKPSSLWKETKPGQEAASQTQAVEKETTCNGVLGMTPFIARNKH